MYYRLKMDQISKSLISQLFGEVETSIKSLQTQIDAASPSASEASKKMQGLIDVAYFLKHLTTHERFLELHAEAIEYIREYFKEFPDLETLKNLMVEVNEKENQPSNSPKAVNNSPKTNSDLTDDETESDESDESEYESDSDSDSETAEPSEDETCTQQESTQDENTPPAVQYTIRCNGTAMFTFLLSLKPTIYSYKTALENLKTKENFESLLQQAGITRQKYSSGVRAITKLASLFESLTSKVKPEITISEEELWLIQRHTKVISGLDQLVALFLGTTQTISYSQPFTHILSGHGTQSNKRKEVPARFDALVEQAQQQADHLNIEDNARQFALLTAFTLQKSSDPQRWRQQFNQEFEIEPAVEQADKTRRILETPNSPEKQAVQPEGYELDTDVDTQTTKRRRVGVAE